MASIAVQLGMQAAGVIGGLLAQHTLRAKDARNENDAANQIVPLFDQDIQEIVSAYNSGNAPADECIAALSQVDQQVYSYLKSQVGKPGTAWRDNYPHCDKSCTVGCCIYNQDLHPSVLNVVNAIQRGGGTANIRKIFPSKYGLSGRDAYAVTITKPSATKTVTGTLQQTIDSIFAPLSGQPDPTSDPLGSIMQSNSPGGNTHKLLIYGAVAVIGVFTLATIFRK